MSVKIYVGDALQRLKELPDNSVDCCVTSPPYWGLRDYGTANWQGGNPDCQHSVFENYHDPKRKTGRPYRYGQRDKCIKCGAVRIDEQIGLENTPDEHITALVKVFQEVRRVLKPEGTLWMNYGDTYLSQTGNGFNANKRLNESNRNIKISKPLPLKNLLGMPWRVAFALQQDGWILRTDIIWEKPNAMPESVKDRPCRSHEYVFLFSKKAHYYYDYKAVLEPVAANDNGIVQHPNALSFARMVKEPERPGHNDCQHRPSRGKGNNKSFRGGGAYVHHQSFLNAANIDKQTVGNKENISGLRNRRTVWTIASRGFSEAHFATFPPELVRPCLLAGCPVGGVVLDPFGGAGTTALEAERQQKNAILIELNPDYADMARRRIVQDGGMFCDVEVVLPKVRRQTSALWRRWLRRKICFWRQNVV